MTRNNACHSGWLGLPSISQFWRTLVFIGGNTLWFALIFGGADWLTGLHSIRLRIDLPIESEIPFVPGAILLYLSIYPLFLLAPFVLRTQSQITAAVRDQAGIITIAGVFFLLMPAELHYPPLGPLGLWRIPFQFADRANLTYNLVPSLHVALSVASVRYYVLTAGPALRVFLWGWAALIAASTLLTHQHHLLDVVAGWILALVMTRNARHKQSGQA